MCAIETLRGLGYQIGRGCLTMLRFAACASRMPACAVALACCFRRRRRGVLAALAYGRQAAREAYDRLLVGAANDIAASITLRDGGSGRPAGLGIRTAGARPRRPGLLRGASDRTANW